jgi:hypothetical protein
MADFHGQTVDTVVDFESALPSGWAETDVSGVLDIANTSADYAGTYGMLYDQTGTAVAYIEYTLPAGHSAVSGGLWYNTRTFTAWNGDGVMVQVMSSTTESALRILFGRSGGDNSLVHRIRNLAGTFSSTNSSWSENTWYWITWILTQNGTMYARIYDTTGTQVGSEVSVACGNVDALTVQIRGNISNATDPWYDDVVVDHTSATYPLLGWVAAGGGGSVVTAYQVYYDRMRRVQ